MVTGAGICQTMLLSETGHLLRARDGRSGPESAGGNAASHNRKQMRAKDRKSSQTVTAEGLDVFVVTYMETIQGKSS